MLQPYSGDRATSAMATSHPSTGPSRSPGPGPVDDEFLLFPTSFAQQRLWFLNQLIPNKAVYVADVAVRLEGDVDVAALRWALTAMIERHESLRTTFVAIDGEPFQRVTERIVVPLEVLDVGSVERAREAASRLALEQFDLEVGPLWRVALVRVAREQSILVLCIHHIVTDGWSMGVFFSELSALYNARVSNQDVSLPHLRIQYADFAVWQRRQLQGERLAELLGYWRQQLDGLTVLELPTDHPRGAGPTFRGGSVPLLLPAEATGGLRVLAQEQGATMFMAVTAVFAALLARYSRQSDIAIGTPIAGRSHSELEPLIGFFVNTIVLRCDLRGDPSYRKLLRATRERALGAYAHEDLPFEKLVEELQPERDLSRNPIFQVTCQLHEHSTTDIRTPTPSRDGSQPSLRFAWATPPVRDQAKFELALNLWAAGCGMAGRLSYSADLFERATAERMARHFAQLVAGVVAEPDLPLSRVTILSAAERNRELVQYNQTAREVPSTCVHELVEAQVERTPDAVAVIGGGRQLSYRELNERANTLAHLLIDLGAGRDRLVGLQLPRSPDLIVALLGVLKSGAAFLPLDPSDPEARRLQIVSDAQPIAVLDRLPALAPRADAPAVRVEPCDSAYVIYTSGSTGSPKGILIEHHSLANYISWFSRTVLSGASRIPFITRIGFDASLKQVFAPLVCGMPVWLPLDEAVMDPVTLASEVAAHAGVALNCVPSHWETILEAMESGRAPSLNSSLITLMLGGDPFPPRLAERTFRLMPAVRVWNLYGPTETTSNALAAQLEPGAPVTVGSPIDNVQALVLDEHRQPVPAGVPGELYLGGEGLARGYLNQPELTARQFTGNPNPPFQRLYRTGDLVRRLADGNLQYLGRLD
ncbi:MAG: amino acid adenylation domain-containing protein, partial [Solirubrobacterales bacterium]|nr:amino acid adenylation domain-containing protein [Solirubrobacterales bacterium]